MTDAAIDIAIVGGGPVGLDLALALTRSMRGLQGRAARPPRRSPCRKDQRASAHRRRRAAGRSRRWASGTRMAAERRAGAGR